MFRHLAQHAGDLDAALEGREVDESARLTSRIHAPATCHVSVVLPPPPFQLRSADHRLLLLLFSRRSTSQVSWADSSSAELVVDIGLEPLVLRTGPRNSAPAPQLSAGEVS